MSDIFAVRKVDEKTREFIYEYAHENDLTTGEALREIARMAKEHMKETPKKKYRSFFEIYDEVKFRSKDPNLSKNIDKYLYGKRD